MGWAKCLTCFGRSFGEEAPGPPGGGTTGGGKDYSGQGHSHQIAVDQQQPTTATATEGTSTPRHARQYASAPDFQEVDVACAVESSLYGPYTPNPLHCQKIPAGQQQSPNRSLDLSPGLKLHQKYKPGLSTPDELTHHKDTSEHSGSRRSVGCASEASSRCGSFILHSRPSFSGASFSASGTTSPACSPRATGVNMVLWTPQSSPRVSISSGSWAPVASTSLKSPKLPTAPGSPLASSPTEGPCCNLLPSIKRSVEDWCAAGTHLHAPHSQQQLRHPCPSSASSELLPIILQTGGGATSSLPRSSAHDGGAVSDAAQAMEQQLQITGKVLGKGSYGTVYQGMLQGREVGFILGFRVSGGLEGSGFRVRSKGSYGTVYQGMLQGRDIGFRVSGGLEGSGFRVQGMVGWVPGNGRMSAS